MPHSLALCLNITKHQKAFGIFKRFCFGYTNKKTAYLTFVTDSSFLCTEFKGLSEGLSTCKVLQETAAGYPKLRK